MQYRWQNSKHKRSSNTRFLGVALLLSIIIQVSIACGFAPQAYSPITLAAPRMMNCVNPMPPDNGLTATPAPATPGIVVINEVLSFPQSQWNCATNADNRWIEIYNPQNQPYDLYAAHASIDQGPGTDSYILRFGSIISAHGFLVIFPFQNQSPNAYPQLSSVRLLAAQTVIDEVTLPALPPDTSFARIPDGSNNWQIMTTPTIGSSNQYIATTTAQPDNNNSSQSHTTKQRSPKTHSGSTANDITSTDTANTGIQPTWSALRLPSPASNNLTTQQHEPAISATTPADSFDPLQKTLLTLLIVMFFSALLWGWRLYKKRRAMKARSEYNSGNENIDERKLERGS